MPFATTALNTALPPTTPRKVLSAIHNIPRRMRSATLLTRPAPPRAPGKENAPPREPSNQFSADHPPCPPQRRRRPAPLLPRSAMHVIGSSLDSPSPRALDVSPPLFTSEDKWAPRDGRIIIKVWVPSTDDVWKLRVFEDVGLEAFRARVAAKVGFDVSFSAVTYGRLRTIGDEETFKAWVAGRVMNGRNTLLTAHRLVLQ